MVKASGGTAVMASRSEAPDSLDYFPTPPWATRALFECVLPALDISRVGIVLEPACGEGHMAEICREYAAGIFASDIFPYGYGAVRDYLDDGEVPAHDWTITNAPFNEATAFAERALFHPASKARHGVALLVRTAWLEGKSRYERLFKETPPNLVGVFAERVPMVKGRWDPAATTATSYAWFVWKQPATSVLTRIVWIPPGQRTLLTRRDDARRFAMKTPAPLLEGAAA
jgi:hypothetical protein